MDAATRFKVVLSDFDTRQHWLAYGASVVLHLCRAWLDKKHTRYAPEGIAEQIWRPESAAGPSASFDTLVNADNRALQLYISDVKRKHQLESVAWDSGYGSNSRTSQPSSLATDPAPQDFKTLGASTGTTSRKLFKRRKISRSIG